MGNKKKYFLLCSLLIQFLYSQDSTDKCGTFSHIRNGFHPKKISFKTTSDFRPALQTSRLTPSGHFRIHFDTSGTNQPSMIGETGNKIPNSYHAFVDTLASILDSVWRSEVDVFHFGAPPSDSTKGGGPEYDYYILNKPSGVFGETIWESDDVFSEDRLYGPYQTYITIDNDFFGYRTTGVPAMMATAAHEFHHAIQLGNTGIWPNDIFYYEMCAEAMESIVFPEARDYLHDLKTYYNSISLIPLFSKYEQQLDNFGYERAVWGIYLMRKFGTDVMKDIWNELKLYRPVTATQNALLQRSTTIQREFVDFSFWNFMTGDRADSSKTFPDSKIFPALYFKQKVQLSEAEDALSGMARSLTSAFYKIASIPDTVGKKVTGSVSDTLYEVRVDTAFLIISNCNYADAEMNNSASSLPFQVSVSSQALSGFESLSPYIYSKFKVADLSQWKMTSIIQSTVDSITGTYQTLPLSVKCFPNPFKPGNRGGPIYMALGRHFQQNNEPELYIYTSSMNLVYSSTAAPILFSGEKFVAWDGKDNRSNVVGSGVYFYFIKKSDGIINGKFTVIR